MRIALFGAGRIGQLREAACRAVLLAFLQVARGEIPSPCTARDALRAMRISVAATTSWLEHRPVLLDELC